MATALRYLVVGGAGFIGSHLVDRLLRDGHAVSVLDNFDPMYARVRKQANLWPAARHEAFRLIEGDASNYCTVATAFERFRPDVIVHLAACDGADNPQVHGKASVHATLQLLEHARTRPGTRFVYASDASVYGDAGPGPLAETASTDGPTSPVGAAKRSGERLCREYHRRHGVAITCLRLFSTYGPRFRPDQTVARFTRLIDQGDPLPVQGDGTCRQDYAFIDDVVGGIARAAERCKGYAIYNLGTSRPVALSRLIDAIGQALGRIPRVVHLPSGSDTVSFECADIRLAERELDYVATTNLEDGMRRTVAWYRAEGEWHGRLAPPSCAA
jgi:UDP-glucuronate 4-epimerase